MNIPQTSQQPTGNYGGRNRERVIKVEASEADFKNVAAIIKDGADKLTSGWKVDAVIKEIKADLETLNVNLGTTSLNELGGFLDSKNPKQQQIYDILLTGNINELADRGVTPKGLEMYYDIPAEKIKRLPKKPTESQIKEETKRIEMLIKEYQEDLPQLTSNNKAEIKDKLMREMEFHLNNIEEVESDDEDFTGAVKKLRAIKDFIEKS